MLYSMISSTKRTAWEEDCSSLSEVLVVCAFVLTRSRTSFSSFSFVLTREEKALFSFLFLNDADEDWNNLHGNTRIKLLCPR